MSGRTARPPRGGTEAYRWDPMRDLNSLRERLNRLLESVQRRGDFSSDGLAGWMPPVDVRENRDEFVLTAEVPGVHREDLQIKVEGAIVTLRGRRAFEKNAISALRIERPYGSFSRTFFLPAPVDGGQGVARIHQGVLEVFLPKAAGSRARPIRVQVH